MNRSSLIPVVCLCAGSSLFVQCGGSDSAGSASAGTGSSSSSGTGSSPSSGIGGSGSSPSTSGGGTGPGQAGAVVLLTGTRETSGFDDGPGPLGLLSDPKDLASDGTHLYILENYMSDSVRSLDMATGIITHIAGSDDYCRDGLGKSAGFNTPVAFALDPIHKHLYVADGGDCGIRKVVIATGEVSTLATATNSVDLGNGSALVSPWGIAIDSTGSRLYVADISAHQIRVIDLATSAMTTLAGSVTKGSADGVGSAATLCGPGSLAIDSTESKLYFVDNCENDVIRVVDIASRQVTTLAGWASSLNGNDGVGSGAGFLNLRNIAIDPTGTNLYASEGAGTRHVIRKIEIASRVVTTLAGSKLESGSIDGVGTAAQLSFPLGLTVVGNALYIADSGNELIRKLALDTTQVTTYAGAIKPASFHDPVNVVSDGTYLYVVDKDNNSIRKVSMASGYTTTLAGSGEFGHADGLGTAATFHFPSGITIAGSRLYVADNGNHAIRAIDLTTQQVTTLAGSYDIKGAADGVGTSASFNLPQGLVADPSGQNLYVTDQHNHEIRKVVIATGQVTTVAGTTESGFSDGVGNAARFNMPANIAVAPQGSTLYVTDASNNAIRKIDIATAQVTTLAGNTTAGITNGVGTNARFDTPWGIVTDGANLYVADGANGIIRRIELASSTVSIQCGRTLYADEDGTCVNALFQVPAGLALDATSSTLYVCDSLSDEIRAVRLK